MGQEPAEKRIQRSLSQVCSRRLLSGFLCNLAEHVFRQGGPHMTSSAHHPPPPVPCFNMCVSLSDRTGDYQTLEGSWTHDRVVYLSIKKTKQGERNSRSRAVHETGKKKKKNPFRNNYNYKTLKIPQKNLGINKFSKIIRYKINIQKSVTFLAKNNF